MSQYLESLKIGDQIQITGPTGMIEYKGEGLFAGLCVFVCVCVCLCVFVCGGV